MVRSGQCCLRGPEVAIGVPSNIATTQLWFAVFCSGRCFRDLSGCSFVTGCGWSGTSNLLLKPQASSRREELQYDREGGPRLGRSCEGLFSKLRRSTGDGLDGPFTSPLHRNHKQPECQVDALVFRAATSYTGRQAPTRKAQSSARLTQQAIQCLTPVSHLRRRRTCTLRLTSAGRRTSASHKGQNPSLRISPVGSLSTVPLHRRVPPGGGTLSSRGEVCYVYSLPPCYFTQSALPNYQTGCCSVLHVLLCPAKRFRRAP